MIYFLFYIKRDYPVRCGLRPVNPFFYYVWLYHFIRYLSQSKSKVNRTNIETETKNKVTTKCSCWSNVVIWKMLCMVKWPGHFIRFLIQLSNRCTSYKHMVIGPIGLSPIGLAHTARNMYSRITRASTVVTQPCQFDTKWTRNTNKKKTTTKYKICVNSDAQKRCKLNFPDHFARAICLFA